MHQKFVWRGMNELDLPDVSAIACRVHPNLPERPEVFAEKWALFPKGCFVLATSDRVDGYAIAHPWLDYDVPALNEFLGAIPKDANCIYLHDVALLESARGKGATAELVVQLKSLARQNGFSNLALVSVYETSAFWRRYGFVEIVGGDIVSKLKAYGETARYMIMKV